MLQGAQLACKGVNTTAEAIPDFNVDLLKSFQEPLEQRMSLFAQQILHAN